MSGKKYVLMVYQLVKLSKVGGVVFGLFIAVVFINIPSFFFHKKEGASNRSKIPEVLPSMAVNV